MATSDSAVPGIVETTLELINGLIGMISGSKASILTTILEQIIGVSDQVSSLGDNLVADIRTVTDQIESSRANIVEHINIAVKDINVHSDENTSLITGQMRTDHLEIMASLGSINEVIGNLGEELGKALGDAIAKVVQSIQDQIGDITSELNKGFERMTEEVTKAIRAQGEVFATAIDHAADSIDRINATLKEGQLLMHGDLVALTNTLQTSLEEHALTINRATLQGDQLIANALKDVAGSNTFEAVSVAAAITLGCSEIAAAIAAGVTLDKIEVIPQLLTLGKTLGLLIPILEAVGGLLALESPEAVAAILTPIIHSYYNIGQAITKDVEKV